MKCGEADIIGYIEGKADELTVTHIKGCRKCSAEALKLGSFAKLVETRYARGKALEEKLDTELSSIKLAGAKKLPPAVAESVALLKKKNMGERLKNIVSKCGPGAMAFIEGLTSPQPQVMPASPKDITKSGRKAVSKKTKR